MTELEIYEQARAGFRATLRTLLDQHCPDGISSATLGQLNLLIQDLQKLASPSVLEDTAPKTEAAEKRSRSEI